VADSSKFNVNPPFRIALLTQVDQVITAKKVSFDALRALRKLGIKALVA
jgi:DeoR/GlpR family transcriptional regulator of sugar metabolism